MSQPESGGAGDEYLEMVDMAWFAEADLDSAVRQDFEATIRRIKALWNSYDEKRLVLADIPRRPWDQDDYLVIDVHDTVRTNAQQRRTIVTAYAGFTAVADGVRTDFNPHYEGGVLNERNRPVTELVADALPWLLDKSERDEEQLHQGRWAVSAWVTATTEYDSPQEAFDDRTVEDRHVSGTNTLLRWTPYAVGVTREYSLHREWLRGELSARSMTIDAYWTDVNGAARSRLQTGEELCSMFVRTSEGDCFLYKEYLGPDADGQLGRMPKLVQIYIDPDDPVAHTTAEVSEFAERFDREATGLTEPKMRAFTLAVDAIINRDQYPELFTDPS